LEFESDLHTHTIFSHGRGTIEDNVKAAIACGLKKIGISDHGPGHVGFGVSRKKLAEMKDEIIRLRKEYPGIEILFGLEANIFTPLGNLDVKPEDFEYFDFVCAGWHYGSFDGMTLAGIGRTLENFARSTAEKASKKQIRRNTDAVVRALETNDIMFLTHPGDKAPIDLRHVAEICAKTGTLIEINTRHMSLSLDDIKMLMSTDVKFIVNSDAHSPKRVGDFEMGAELIEASGLDHSRVVNLTETGG